MKITIRTDGFEGFKVRSLERAKKIDRGERLVPERIIGFESTRDMLEQLGARNVPLCALNGAETFSVRTLAAILERSPQVFRRDLRRAVASWSREGCRASGSEV